MSRKNSKNNKIGKIKSSLLEGDNSIPELETISKVPHKNYGNIPTMSREIIYKLPVDRITSEIMTKFEYCEAISIRSKQIEDGGESFTDIGELTDPIEIAKKEIFDRRCPLSVVRHITPTLSEVWHVNEMNAPIN